MQLQNKNDNAANRKSYVGSIYNIGEKAVKESVLNSLDEKWAKLHREGYIHIHDLDAYGLTYNCLTFDLLKAFPYSIFAGLSDVKAILGVFDFLKELFERVGNEQSGGMALANFDNDLASIFMVLGIDYKGNEEIFRAAIRDLIIWCNNTHTRMGQTSYYISFNIGLAENDFARFLAFTLLDELYHAGELVYKPNIIFKVAKGISRNTQDRNYDLLMKAFECTGKKMIPTYLLCDCEMDKGTSPELLSVMGCRTRVVADRFGKTGAIGRSNIDNITINLPRLALETIIAHPDLPPDALFEKCKEKWLSVADTVTEILLDRFHKTCSQDVDLFPALKQYDLLCENINKTGLSEVFKHGTLSIGFIGLSEMLDVIFDGKFWEDEKIYNAALNMLSFMRGYTDMQAEKYNLNFSLLATSGELISGRFVEIDQTKFKSDIFKKGFYTNSFHVEVDSKIPAWEKIEKEGKFHAYCNGGCISYVELAEAPIGNPQGLDELVEIAINAGVHYLGFNYPKDVCAECGTSGTFDICPVCNSSHIKRIRRVSGYLEIQDYFTSGKKHEVKARKAN